MAVILKGKDLFPERAKYFLLRLVPSEKGGNYFHVRVIFFEYLSIALKRSHTNIRIFMVVQQTEIK